MPKIAFSISKNDVASPTESAMKRRWGAWRIEITAGLDESPEDVLREAFDIALGTLRQIPKDERYPMHHIETLNESSQ